MTSFFQIHSAHAITPSESIRLSQQRMSPPGSWLSFPWPATGVVSHQALVIDWRTVEQKLHRTGWEEEESETNQDTAFLENALQYNQLCEIGLQGKHGSGGRRSLAGQVWYLFHLIFLFYPALSFFSHLPSLSCGVRGCEEQTEIWNASNHGFKFQNANLHAWC